MTIEECIDLVLHWSATVEQEFCVGAKEHEESRRERDEVEAFIRDLAAQAALKSE